MKSPLLSQQILLISLLFILKTHSSLIPIEIECDFNEKMCLQSNCLLAQGRGKFKYFSAYCNLAEELKSAKLHIDFLRKTKTGEYQPTPFKIRTDVCKLYDERSGSGIMKNLLSLSAESLSHLKCPLKGNVTVTRMPLLTFVIQGFITNGDYKISVKCFTDVSNIVNMNISVRVTK